MRIFKFLAMLTISVLLFTGCEKEEFTNYAFQEISAPTNVKADFEVAQDDSGDVTITPSGEGAQVFNVYIGDGDDTPVEVASGETTSYTYGEGEYLVRVVAVGATGLTSEFNQRLLISFNAPENLEVKVDQSAINPALVSISASADFAATFDVYFGDTEVALSSEEASAEEEPVQLLPDGSIDYTYAAPGTYTIRVVAKGAGAATIQTTVEVVVPEANDPVKLPITYDIPTVNYALGTFNGAEFEVVTNPFLSGANTEESMVGKLTNSGALYEGGAYDLTEQPVDFSGDSKTISMKFYSDQAVSVLVKFEGGTNDDRPNEVSADHGGTGWEVLTFDFRSDALTSYLDGASDNGQAFVPTGKYSTLVIFAEIGKPTVGTFYIDDVEFDGANGGDANGQISDDFDANRNIGTWYGDACGMDDAFANPFKTGINTSETVLEYNDDGGQYANVGFDVVPNFDLTVDNTFTLKIYVPSSSITGEQPNQISLKLQDGTVGEPWAQQTEIIKSIELDQWQTLTFDFANDVTAGAADPLGRTDFNRVVLQVNGENNTDLVIAYIDDFIYGEDNGNGSGEPTVATSLPINFESNETFSGVFEGGTVTGMPVSNPDMSGANTSSTVFEFTKGDGAVWYSGIFQIFPSNIDLSSEKSFSFKIWSPKAGINVRFQLEKEGGGGGPTVSLDQTISEANKWVTLTYNFEGVVNSADAYDKFVIFPEFDSENETPGDGSVYYIDDVMQTTGGTIAKTSFPINFETPETGGSSEFKVFENVDNPPLEIIANPDASGANTSATVAKFTARQAGQLYAGVETQLSTPFTLDASNSTATIMVWKSVISDVGLQVVNASNGSTATIIKVSNTVTGQWEELTFDLSDYIGEPGAINTAKLVIFPDWAARSQDNVIYFDNITFGSN
jgi:hypothetical protein